MNTHGARLKTMTPAERKVTAYRAQGIRHVKSGKYTQAIARLKKAMRLDPNDLATRQHLARAYHGLGQYLFDKKEYDRARDNFQEGLKVDSDCMPCQKGLAAYRRIIPEAAARLRAGGALILEIGWNQGAAVARLAERSRFYRDWQCLGDYSGHERVVHLTRA